MKSHNSLVVFCFIFCTLVVGIDAKEVGVFGLPVSPLLDAIAISAAIIVLFALCFSIQESKEGGKHH